MYGRKSQMLAASIRDIAGRDECRMLNRRSKRGPHHRNILYKTSNRRNEVVKIDDDSEPDIYLQIQMGPDKLMSSPEMFFESSRFARYLRDFKRNQGPPSYRKIPKSIRYSPPNDTLSASSQGECFKSGQKAAQLPSSSDPKTLILSPRIYWSGDNCARSNVTQK